MVMKYRGTMVQEVKKKTNRFTIRLISRNRVKKGRKPFFSLPFFILQPKKQIQEDLEYDQMSLKEYIDPFTGEPVNLGKK